MACFLSTGHICGDPKDRTSGIVAETNRQGRKEGSEKPEELAARPGCNFALAPVVGASGNDGFSVEMNQLYN